jgi:hypothetical protein
MFALALTKPAVAAITSDVSLEKQIARLYAAGRVGPQYDLTRLETMFTTAAGSTNLDTPGNGTGQFVGRLEDISGGGYHAKSPNDSTARPQLSGKVNMLLNTPFAGAVAGSPGTAPTSWSNGNNGGSIDSLSGGVLTFSAAAGRRYLQQVVVVQPYGIYKARVYVNTNANGLAATQLIQWNQALSGATETWYVNGAVGTSASVPTADSLIEVVLTLAGTGGTLVPRFGIGTSSTVTGTVGISLPDIRFMQHSTRLLPDYQEIVSAESYTDLGFRELLFNGTGQGLKTDAFDPGLNCVTVGVASRRNATDALRIVAEHTPILSSNNGAWYISAPNSFGSSAAFSSKGTSATDAIASSLNNPNTCVIIGQGSIAGDVATIHANRVPWDHDIGDQGTGNYANDATSIGYRHVSTGGSWFNGGLGRYIEMYGTPLTASERAVVEAWINEAAKAY